MTSPRIREERFPLRTVVVWRRGNDKEKDRRLDLDGRYVCCKKLDKYDCRPHHPICYVISFLPIPYKYKVYPGEKESEARQLSAGAGGVPATSGVDGGERTQGGSAAAS